MNRMIEIEHLIAIGDLTPAQVFEKMKVLVPQWVAITHSRPVSEKFADEVKYLVDSSYGVGCAYMSNWSAKFQWCASGEDEGMSNMDRKIFEVYRWQEMPESSTEIA